MTDQTATTLMMRKILRPLVRLLLRNGVAFADFSNVARRTFVEVASEDFDIPGRKQSVSRVSVLTGINRKEVKRLLEEPAGQSKDRKENNRAARVVGGWMRDKEFHNTEEKPQDLSWGSGGVTEGSFEALVKRYSGDMTARAILDELARVGAVSLNENKDTVSLVARGYVPASSGEELLRLSGDSIYDLLSTIDHNFLTEDTTRFQLKVDYDNVPANGVELFRSLSKEKATELLTYLNQFLSTQDRTINPAVEGEGRYRTGLGIYYFEEPIEEAAEDQTDHSTAKATRREDAKDAD